MMIQIINNFVLDINQVIIFWNSKINKGSSCIEKFFHGFVRFCISNIVFFFLMEYKGILLYFNEFTSMQCIRIPSMYVHQKINIPFYGYLG